VPKQRHWKHRLVVLCYRLVRLAQRRVPPGARSLVGIVLMTAGVFGFLPVLGFWMLPLGLALLAMDLPFLRRPLARFMAFINGKLAAQAK